MIEVVDGQRQLNACKRIVVKIGSSLLTANGQGLDLNAISHWAKQIADLHNAGHEIILCLQEQLQKGWYA
jgi:glutamate 5-kinase